MLDSLAVLAIAAGIIVFGLCLRNWRVGIVGLLVFMPFVGLPTIFLYPAPPTTRVLKDVVFLLPAYVGFGAWYLKTRPSGHVPKLLTIWGVALVLLVLVHMSDRAVPDLTVALIGLKTWVFYIPLTVLGYYLIDRTTGLDKLVKTLLLVGAFPIVLGVAQAALVSAGASDLAYSIYGAAAFDVTHGFGRTEIGTGDLVKVASTFTFLSQYYNFVLAMLCLAYGRWRSLPPRSALRFWSGLVPLAIVALAGMTTGSRGAFVMIPLFFIIALVLDADWAGLAQIALLFSAGLTTALALFNTSLGDLSSVVQDLAVDYLTVTQVGELKGALSTTVWGLGTGTNTGPARLADLGGGANIFENYFAKAVMELGVPGLLLVVLLFGTVLVVGFQRTRRLRKPSSRAYANSILAFLVISVVNGWKASYFDLDPLNVYFWFYAGILFRIPMMDSLDAALSPVPLGAIPVTGRPLWTRRQRPEVPT